MIAPPRTVVVLPVIIDPAPSGISVRTFDLYHKDQQNEVQYSNTETVLLTG